MVVHGPKPAAVGFWRVLHDVEVEVHADPLEEVVVERDEADLDGDLQVLHAPQLLQEVDDLLVDFLRLADDEAEVGFEGGDRARSAHRVPGGGLDGGGDQVDEAVEVGLGAAAQSAGPGAGGLALPAGQPPVPAPGRRRPSGPARGVDHAAVDLAAVVCWPPRPGACSCGGRRMGLPPLPCAMASL